MDVHFDPQRVSECGAASETSYHPHFAIVTQKAASSSKQTKPSKTTPYHRFSHQKQSIFDRRNNPPRDGKMREWATRVGRTKASCACERLRARARANHIDLLPTWLIGNARVRVPGAPPRCTRGRARGHRLSRCAHAHTRACIRC